MSKEELINKLESDLEDYENPGTYCESDYYDRCRAKADYIKELLSWLKSKE